jgi:hypothetical protein
MRYAIAILVMCLVGLSVPAQARSSGSNTHYANQGGHYVGGRGSSHKGGHYRNARTGNHYTHHK